jgi:lipoprotein signal peptidase
MVKTDGDGPFHWGGFNLQPAACSTQLQNADLNVLRELLKRTASHRNGMAWSITHDFSGRLTFLILHPSAIW